MQGIIIINKPQEYTSQDVVSKVKKLLNIKKAGHTGTLDPLATGVLPVLLGEYTKIAKYLVEHNKTYIATIKLGEKKDTGDLEGKTIEEKPVLIYQMTDSEIEKKIKTFLGKQKQIPPMYSAVKINGKKLYEYARQGQKVEVPERDIEIQKIELLKIDRQKNELEIEVSCSKGTYIRVLCEDIAKKLNTVGYMSSLIRTKVDKFDIKNSITFEQLEENKSNNEFLNNNIIKMETIFNNLPQIILNNRKKELFLNGVMLTYEKNEGIYNIYDENKKYIGLGIIKNNLLKRDVVIL